MDANAGSPSGARPSSASEGNQRDSFPLARGALKLLGGHPEQGRSGRRLHPLELLELDRHELFGHFRPVRDHPVPIRHDGQFASGAFGPQSSDTTHAILGLLYLPR